MARWWSTLALLLRLVPALARTARLRTGGRTDLNVDFKVRLDNFNNVQYSGDFMVGSQRLPVIYDTGSFEILVLSTLCGTECGKGHSVYDQRKSPSFAAAKGVTAEHLFGSGPVLSEKGFETVRVGGPDSPYAVRRMPFWQVVEHGIAAWNEHAAFSGIVGFGHPSLIPEDFASGLDPDPTLLALLGVDTFAICLQRHSSRAPGWLRFGASVKDQTERAGFRTLRLVGQVHWGVRLTDVGLAGIDAPNPCRPSCGAVVDSGTSLIAVPTSAMPMVRKLAAHINRDCSNLHELPTLRFRLDGTEVELPPQAYVMQVNRAARRNTSLWDALFSDSRAEASSSCKPAFMTLDKESQHGPVWILGMPFLRYYYTVFDREAKEIRIARTTPKCSPMPHQSLVATPTAEATRLFNASHLHADDRQGSAAFTAADYQPLKVDLSAARIPDWASAGWGKAHSKKILL